MKSHTIKKLTIREYEETTLYTFRGTVSGRMVVIEVKGYDKFSRKGLRNAAP